MIMPIMTSLKKVFLTFAASISVITAMAQAHITLGISARQIGIEDLLQVEYAIKNAEQVSPLSNIHFNGWQIVGGPQTSQQMTSINGNVQQSISYVYFLRPLSKGKLNIPGATVIADGKKISCAGTSINVVNHSAGQQAPSRSSNAMPGIPGGLQSLLDQMRDDNDAPESEMGGNVLRPGEMPADKIKQNMFIKVSPSKSVCYVGEPVLVTYELFTALGSTSKISKQPAFNGVGVVDFTQNPTPSDVTVNGKRFKSYVLRKVQLTPLQAGSIDLGQAEVSCTVPFSSIQDPYHPQDYTTSITNKRTVITAKELPEGGRPADFSGAIGQFSITVKPEQVSSPVGENNMLHIRISGTGNLQSAVLPPIGWPKGLEHYDGTDSQQVDKNGFPPLVLKSFDIPVVGTQEGSVAIPSVSFSYFDPQAETYKTIHSVPTSILFTKALPKKFVDNNNFADSIAIRRFFWIPVAAVLLIFFIVIWISFSKKKKRKVRMAAVPSKELDSDSEQAPMEPAPQPSAATAPQEDNSRFAPQAAAKAAPTDFHAALLEIELENDNWQFFNLSKALLTQYLQERLGSTEASGNELIARLRPKGNTESRLADSCQNTFQKIDQYLYSPIANGQDRLAVSDELRKIFNA